MELSPDKKGVVMDKADIRILFRELYVLYPILLVELMSKDETRGIEAVQEMREAILKHEVRGSKPVGDVVDQGDNLVVTLKHSVSGGYMVRLVDDLKEIVLHVLGKYV